MRTTALNHLQHPVPSLILLAAVVGCAGKPAPTAAPRPTESRTAGLQLAQEWRARVALDRSDSIILTLPGGQSQLQQMRRHASFTLSVGPRAAVTLRLDSLTMVPAPGRASIPMVGTVWTGRLVGNRVEWLATAGAGPVVEDLAADVADFFPRLPDGGVRAGAKWADTSTTKGRVDIFEGVQRFTTSWSVGGDTAIAGGGGMIVRASGEVEQSGKGSQAGVDMSMTGQGGRSATYYLLNSGQIARVSRKDSMNVMISIPSSHQIVPTLRYIRSQVVFSPIMRD